MVRMIEAVLARKYPQIEIVDTVTLRDYETAGKHQRRFRHLYRAGW